METNNKIRVRIHDDYYQSKIYSQRIEKIQLKKNCFLRPYKKCFSISFLKICMINKDDKIQISESYKVSIQTNNCLSNRSCSKTSVIQMLTFKDLIIYNIVPNRLTYHIQKIDIK